MTIKTSAGAQLKIIENKKHKKSKYVTTLNIISLHVQNLTIHILFQIFHRYMATNVNKENFWSKSLTKHVLTTYAEGLACKNFDQKVVYNVRRYSVYVWLVLKRKQA